MKILKRRMAEALQDQILRQSLLQHGIRHECADFLISAQIQSSKTSHYHTNQQLVKHPPSRR